MADARPRCQYWDKCYRNSAEHSRRFRHPTDDAAPTPPPVTAAPAAAAAATLKRKRDVSHAVDLTADDVHGTGDNATATAAGASARTGAADAPSVAAVKRPTLAAAATALGAGKRQLTLLQGWAKAAPAPTPAAAVARPDASASASAPAAAATAATGKRSIAEALASAPKLRPKALAVAAATKPRAATATAAASVPSTDVVVAADPTSTAAAPANASAVAAPRVLPAALASLLNAPARKPLITAHTAAASASASVPAASASAVAAPAVSALKARAKAVSDAVEQKWRDQLMRCYQMEFPSDLFVFWRFVTHHSAADDDDCERAGAAAATSPLALFELPLGVRLCGPFDVLAGRFDALTTTPAASASASASAIADAPGGSLSPLDYHLHCRYVFDPPELQTVAVSTGEVHTATLRHWGYYRDDPNTLPAILVAAEPRAAGDVDGGNGNGKLVAEADSLFALFHLLLRRAQKSVGATASAARRQSIAKWLDAIAFHAGAALGLDDKALGRAVTKSPAYAARRKAALGQPFTGLGVVVPFTKSGPNELGWRPVTETNASLRKTFAALTALHNASLVHAATLQRDRKDADGDGDGDGESSSASSSAAAVVVVRPKKNPDWAEYDRLLSLVTMANDEGDPGMALEYGLNLFCAGAPFQADAARTLALAYRLLKRPLYAQITEAHEPLRRRLLAAPVIDKLATAKRSK